MRELGRRSLGTRTLPLRNVAPVLPGAAQVVGVDPSPVMRRMAVRRCAGAVAAGRVDVRSGRATDTGAPGGSFDHVVSVNNVLFWGDIAGGIAELHRVLRDGGRAVVAFHSGTGPSRRARRVGLPEDVAVRLHVAMAAVFGDATRHDLTHLVAFSAVRGAR
ncbi:class I SAM-dependent methyltransferase [Micromonospora yasonensis]|uniref:class I SAM-dependent methyltransferase n=1 Tax=Micromonospora yasonensis TaxID=1128667 RepID=UPI00222F51F8|nr:class I SAM-dependent methyltransferase [Micromonospora yasonensis]MCW3844719.1 class I SAM-dependent methyltransferase [Micromonospora yasonensis]